MNSQAAPAREGPATSTMVTIRCGDSTWTIEKHMLCSKSLYFNRALTNCFEESGTGVFELNVAPHAAAWFMEHITTGKFDVPSRDPTAITKFLECAEVFLVADYFGYPPLATIAADTLDKEFAARLKPIQQFNAHTAGGDWLPELIAALNVVYQGSIPGAPRPADDVRLSFVRSIHPARFFLLQEPRFQQFVRGDCPAFGFDLFTSMLTAGDFITSEPNPQCCFCNRRPQNLADPSTAFFSHVAVWQPSLRSACAECAGRRNLGDRISDWCFKRFSTTTWGRRNGGGAGGT